MTSSFSVKGRERWEAVMRSVGYMELDAFFGKADNNGYYCYSCRYFIPDQPTSPTGSWCLEYHFPDKAEGCCNGYEPIDELKNRPE